MNKTASCRLSRRSFLQGLSACGVLSGCRLFEGGGSFAGRPNVRIGVISDIHIQCGCDPASAAVRWNCTSDGEPVRSLARVKMV